jgi:predicted dehydrogenase
MNGSTSVLLIGYGYAGRTFHAPLIRATPGLDLVAVCSSDAARVHRDLPGMEVVARTGKAIPVTAADVVVIATPTATHAPLAAAALRAGKHVVIEKPFALTLAAAQEISTMASASGRVLSVFHNRRWDGDFLTLRQVLAEGRLGPVVHFESHFDRYRPEVKDRWRERPGPGAGVWSDLGPHLVDQALLMFGLPERVTAHLAALRAGALVDDWAHVILDYPGLRVVLHASMIASGRPVRFMVQGERGTWVQHGLDVQEQQLQQGLGPADPAWGENADPGQLIDGATGGVVETATSRGSYEYFYAAFRDAVLGRGPGPVPLADALAVTAVVEIAIESSRQRRALAVVS